MRRPIFALLLAAGLVALSDLVSFGSSRNRRPREVAIVSSDTPARPFTILGRIRCRGADDRASWRALERLRRKAAALGADTLLLVPTRSMLTVVGGLGRSEARDYLAEAIWSASERARAS